MDIVDLRGVDNLAGTLAARVARLAKAEAHRPPDAQGTTWSSLIWSEFAVEVCRCQTALRAEGLGPGDRVAVMLPFLLRRYPGRRGHREHPGSW